MCFFFFYVTAPTDVSPSLHPLSLRGALPVLPEPEPVHAATAQQALRILSLSIAGMPDRRRLAFERFVFADRTAGQVATEMGVSVKMIEKHVAQARAYCRQMLDAGACSLPEACSQR